MAEIVQLSAHLSGSAGRGRPTPASEATAEQNLADQDAVFANLKTLVSQEVFDKYLSVIVARPLLVPTPFTRRLKDVQVALNKAYLDIIGRWWTDEKAGFPARMPLAKHEEELLRWIDGPGKDFVPAYSANQGFWRPDYLIHKDNYPIICEVNSRLPLNGLLHAVFSYDSVAVVLGTESSLVPNMLKQDAVDALFTAFDPTKPLHMILDEWMGFGTAMLPHWWPQMTGQPARYVKPADLRLVPSASSPLGVDLYCVAPETTAFEIETIEHGGERLEKIARPLIELFQREYANLSSELQHYLAVFGVNDFRSNLLSHDKRLLAILHEELDSLVDEHHILTKAEATLLRESVAVTYSPGSQRMKDLVAKFEADASDALKDSYIAKASRLGLSDGLTYGSQVSQSEWLNLVRPLADAHSLDAATHVVQKFVPQQRYDAVLKDGKSIDWFQRVGSYFAFNGVWLGDGPWRVNQNDKKFMSRDNEGHMAFTYHEKENVRR